MTSLPWTICGLGGELDRFQIANVIHQAALRRLTTVDEIEAVLALRGRVTGRREIVAAIAMYRRGSSGTRSSLEDEFLVMLRRLGIPVRIVNVHVKAGDQEFEVDVPFLSRMLCLEVDGPLHDEPDQQERDRVRDAALWAAGYTVERFHWRDLRYRPEVCEARLQRLFAT